MGAWTARSKIRKLEARGEAGATVVGRRPKSRAYCSELGRRARAISLMLLEAEGGCPLLLVERGAGRCYAAGCPRMKEGRWFAECPNSVVAVWIHWKRAGTYYWWKKKAGKRRGGAAGG
mmetsp:Transcript_2858/g.3647  ORF Transcript_2858/g.3647 Transcript_2858/m.3647 type:complete len:119 (-) Transcript_2858:138-494(-)